MVHFPDTRDSLIQRVGDHADAEAWEDFVRIYRPAIYRIGRSRGLSEADAQDMAQQVLLSVATNVGKWEKRSGIRFRNWLSRITRNATLKFLTRAPKDRAAGGTSVLNQLNAEPAATDEDLVDLEFRRQVFLEAAEMVKGKVHPESWTVFELSVLQEVPIDEVAERLGRTQGSIYAIRSRVMRRLAEATAILTEGEGDA